jgi:four helix bundle protein
MGGFASRVDELEVFKRAYQVSLDIHRSSLRFPRIEQYGGLADQMRRASKSICANLAEGFGKQSSSRAEFNRYVMMAMGSADEMRIWVKYCCDLAYVDQATCQVWQEDYQQIAKMLQGLSKHLK